MPAEVFTCPLCGATSYSLPYIKYRECCDKNLIKGDMTQEFNDDYPEDDDYEPLADIQSIY